MLVYFNGLALGLSLITALGPQNVFLIRQGAKRQHPVLCAVICFICDIILVFASVTGLNHVLQSHPGLQIWMTAFGVLFLLYYGATTLRSGLSKKDAVVNDEVQGINRKKIVLLALGFSLLNPHAIIDSLVIIGGGSSQFPGHEQIFLLGVLTSSLLWFGSLTLATHRFSNTLSQASVWQRIEICSGLLMLFLSAKLAFS